MGIIFALRPARNNAIKIYNTRSCYNHMIIIAPCGVLFMVLISETVKEEGP